MNFKYFLLYICILSFISCSGYKKYSGTVLTEYLYTIPGCLITNMNTNENTITDSYGCFVIYKHKNDTIKFDNIGYYPFKSNVNQSQIIMKDSTKTTNKDLYLFELLEFIRFLY